LEASPVTGEHKKRKQKQIPDLAWSGCGSRKIRHRNLVDGLLSWLGLLQVAAWRPNAQKVASALHCATRFMGVCVWLIPGKQSVTRMLTESD